MRQLLVSRDRSLVALEAGRLRARRAKIQLPFFPSLSSAVILLLTSDSKFCFRLAKKLNMIVIDADYRKAPAHPFPLISKFGLGPSLPYLIRLTFSPSHSTQLHPPLRFTRSSFILCNNLQQITMLKMSSPGSFVSPLDSIYQRFRWQVIRREGTWPCLPPVSSTPRSVQ